MMKSLTLLGATGSIGESTLKVLRQHPDRFSLKAIAGHRRWEQLAAIAREFGVRDVALYCPDALEAARSSDAFLAGTRFHGGLDGLVAVSTLPEVDTVIAAIVGTTSLRPALAALRAGKHLALANKEILVMAGQFVMAEARAHRCDILPLDSEHNAIFQCLQGERREDVDAIILTASGGPFRDFSREQMRSISREQALKHPNWDMGAKVTVDSSTMANKGLEVIEAHWLFGFGRDKIEVVVHPQSIVHSMVRYVDGSVIAQLSPPHMCFAIQHALLYPERGEGCVPTLDFTQAQHLTFCPPDYERFPCLRLAMDAM
ncbi:MAG: 1-deoxy-D-xylulose-5-phosphate reductoisomerase, partial [Opitutales bacterium]